MQDFEQKRIALINDLTGFGRCSLTVSIPILSAMGMECCPLPTAVLSNHTGFSEYFLDDYTEKIMPYFEQWKRMNLKFDGIYTGFLGSEVQVKYVGKIIQALSSGAKIIVDPAMADNGKPYASCTRELCIGMRELVAYSDVITPNLTEACILAGMEYNQENFKESELKKLCDALKKLGAKNIIITGLETEEYVSNYVLTKNGSDFVSIKKRTQLRAGTGDVFASVVTGYFLDGIDLYTATKKAADFIAQAMDISDKMKIPPQQGVCFEKLLGLLVPNDI